MSSFIKPDDCEYHNSPYKKFELDDGSYARITKSVLDGQPLLAVATRTYKHTADGMKPQLVLLDIPISNCPFCGSHLPAVKLHSDGMQAYYDTQYQSYHNPESALFNANVNYQHAKSLLEQYTGEQI